MKCEQLMKRFKVFHAIPLIFLSSSAFAWSSHQTLMISLSDSFGPELSYALSSRIQVDCEQKNNEMSHELITELQLNPQNVFSPLVPHECIQGQTTMTALEILTGKSVDEPDAGMDQNLDSKFDPANERKWMGGTSGPTSQGFRHMYFGGMNPRHPLASLQFPIKAIGQAPNRVEILAKKARELINKGEYAWGFRVLAWALHYVQDLAQPYHTTQVPAFNMIAWFPPNVLIPETTRVISNYHYAFEDYTLLRLKDESPLFTSCLSKPSSVHGALNESEISKLSPKELALKVASKSVEIAPVIGSDTMKLFGLKLKNKEFDLANNIGTPNYKDYENKDEFKVQREALESATCIPLANAALVSKQLINWVLTSK